MSNEPRTPSPARFIRDAKLADEPMEYQRAYLGDVVRLEIPLQSVQALRRVSEELHGLATQLDYLARFSKDPPSSTLLQARFTVQRIGRKIEKIRGRGRPKRSRKNY